MRLHFPSTDDRRGMLSDTGHAPSPTCKGESHGRAGDGVLQPAGIVHNELECSDDLEVLEIYSPAMHQTVAVDTMPAAD